MSHAIDATLRLLDGVHWLLSTQTPTKEVFAKLDHDSSGEVHYHEFLAATLEAHELLNEEVLQDTFDRMDHDDSGVISRENLRSLLGSRASDELVETLMHSADASSWAGATAAEQVSGMCARAHGELAA